MTLGSGLAQLDGYPFEVRYSDGARERARAVGGIAADAYAYLGQIFGGFEPDIALVVAARGDWASTQPYGLPFFNNEEGQIRPGIVVMPAGAGDFWAAIGQDIRDASRQDYARLLGAYPDGSGGLDLQPFFDLVTIHELGHAFEMLGGLRLPTFWLGEIFANMALRTFVASRLPQALSTLEVLPTVGAQSRRLGARMRAEGYSTLEQLEAHYAGGDQPMELLNYVWYQHRWLRLAARTFEADGELALVRFWEGFRAADRVDPDGATAASLAPLLRARVSETLGRGVQRWR